MKKNVIALLLSVVLAAGSIGSTPVFAAETSAQGETSEVQVEQTATPEVDMEETEEEADPVSEEESKEQETDSDQTDEAASESNTEQAVEEELEQKVEETSDEDAAATPEVEEVETTTEATATPEVEATPEVGATAEAATPEVETTKEIEYLPIIVDGGVVEDSGRSAANATATWDAEKLSSLQILDTDVSSASDGCVMLGLPGEYIAAQQAVLDRINEIRKEACDEGVKNPETNQPLTSEDYVPLKWSHELEDIARIRAAEASVTGAHVRTNGNSWQSIDSEYTYVGECVAWNYGRSATSGIEQWYGEKKYWLDGNSSDSGHYTTLIRPSMHHVGAGTFYSPNTQYPNATVVEFYTEEGLDDSFADMTGECIQTLEVTESNLNGNPSLIGTLSGVKNDENPLFLGTNTKFNVNFDISSRNLLFLDGVDWSSSDNSVVSVSGDGVARAVNCGSSTITALAENGVSATADFTVNHVLGKIPAVDATCTKSGLTEGEKCVNCGTITIAQETVPAKGHNYGNWTVTKDATYTEEGIREKVCVDCGDKVTETIAKLKKPVKDLTISGITNKTYTGKEQTQAIVITDDSTTLKSGTDYTVTYKNNINAGTATVVIEGIGNYSGSVTEYFAINKAANAVTAKNITKTYAKKAQSFTLGAKATGGTLTYTSNNKKVTVNKAGKVTVKAKFIGKATITITAQNANYNTVTKKITVTVNPTKTTLSSVKNSASKKMTVKWKKNAVGTGYQIQYSTAKSFKGAKTVTITKNKSVSKTVGGLKIGKKYFVRIRTYKKVGKVKFYSGWSKIKTVKIKK